MSYPITVYVDAYGNIYGASHTDQRYTTSAHRTVNGRLVILAGQWYGSQMAYRPYREAVAAAAQKALDTLEG